MAKKEAVGLVILRVILGITFLIHGYVKFNDGIEYTVGYFEMLGLPGFAAYVVAQIELIGGIVMVLGLGTRIVAGLFAIIMIGAIFSAKLSLGFLDDGQMAGYELDLVLFAMSIYLALKSRSYLALDNVIFRTKRA